MSPNSPSKKCPTVTGQEKCAYFMYERWLQIKFGRITKHPISGRIWDSEENFENFSLKKKRICGVYLAIRRSNTPFCNWRWPIDKTDSTQEQNSAPHPAAGAERLADVRNNSAKFGFSSSFSITSTLCVNNGISSKQFGIDSKRFDKVPPTFEPM